MDKFSLHIDNSKDIFLENLRSEMKKTSTEVPDIDTFIKNELGLTNITDDDFLSPDEKELSDLNFERVRGNTCLQQRKVMTKSQEQNIYLEAFKYR